MNQYSFDEVKRYLLKCIENDFEEELSLYINGIEYMIIIYDGYCDFIKCGVECECKQYDTLDDLFIAEQMDNIILQRDWHLVSKIEPSFGEDIIRNYLLLS